VTSDFRCSNASEARDESLAGTASRADRLVLVEFPTPWPAKAVEVFGDEVRTELSAVVGAANAKILLIRRHGRRTEDVRRWAVTDVRNRKVIWGSWEAPSDLAGLISQVDVPSDGWSNEPIALVCTHALHDACCGVRGRPVAAALAETHGDVVWESSHLGGHRFAGNVVMALDGTYYGRLNALSGPATVGAHLAGEVTSDALRGFSWMDPAAQVVAAEAHRRWGPAPAEAVTDASVVPVGERRWQVRLSAAEPFPGRMTAEVESVPGGDARLSCHAEPMPTESFRILSFDPAGH
jgi:hypothetical protein